MMKFVPPIAATSVRLVDFNHTNGAAKNTMDFVMGALPSGSDTTLEGWYFADPSASDAPVGYAFPNTASCTTPYDVEGSGAYCSRDNLASQNNAPTALFLMNETVTLSRPVAAFEMGLVQGCQSSLEDPPTTGEQFRIEIAPGTDGVWKSGIQVR